MRRVILLALLLSIPAAVMAQDLTDLKTPYLAKGKTSLFDPSRLKMQQSYTFGYYSGRGGSGSIGYYLNSLEYTFSNPLKVRIDLGFLHNPSAILSGRSSVSNSGAFVPGFSIDWRPSSYFQFRLDYHQVPALNYGGYSPYYNPFYGEDNR